MNWDLLVNFSSKDLTPTPGIAESWDVSDDRKTVTFHLDPDAKWSDGKPITSEDVKYSLEVLGSHGALFTSYTDNITKIETPNDDTVVIHTKRPDARIVGGLFIYILPKHVWGKVPVSDLTGSYDPKFPLVGSGPYVVTDFEPNRITKLEKNPNFRGPEPKFDEIQFIRYGNQDAAERALQVGEVDMVPEVSAAGFARLGDQPNIDTFKASSPAYTQMAFNSCSVKICPDANYNPAIQDTAVRQATAYAVDRERINADRRPRHLVPWPRNPAAVLQVVLRGPCPGLPLRPGEGEADPRRRRLASERGRPADQGQRGAQVQPLRPLGVAINIQAAKLVAEQAKAVGIEYDVQVVSTDKLYDLTVGR